MLHNSIVFVNGYGMATQLIYIDVKKTLTIQSRVVHLILLFETVCIYAQMHAVHPQSA